MGDKPSSEPPIGLLWRIYAPLALGKIIEPVTFHGMYVIWAPPLQIVYIAFKVL